MRIYESPKCELLEVQTTENLLVLSVGEGEDELLELSGSLNGFVLPSSSTVSGHSLTGRGTNVFR